MEVLQYIPELHTGKRTHNLHTSLQFPPCLVQTQKTKLLVPYHKASLPNLPHRPEAHIKQHWALVVQNWSEDDLGGAAETRPQSISSVVAGQDRLAMGICKKYCSGGACG